MNTIFRNALLLAALSVTIGNGTLHAQQLKMGDTLPMDSTVRTGQLENGMTYFIRHNAQPAGMVDFYIVYDVGSIQEEDSQSGLAHFLEHMAFNGSKHFPGNSMTRWLESLGMQFGTNINAATGMEMTYYQLMQVPLKRESVVDSMLLILHDWSGSLLLEKKEIDKERGVIIEERRQRNTPQFRIGTRAAASVYGDTRYAHRDMLGSEEFLRTFNPRLLRDYYKKWYRPDLQAIVIVGDFDVAQMEERLKRVMADIPKPKRPEPKAVIPIPDNKTPIVTILTDPEQPVCKANFYIKRPAVPKELNDKVGANVMNMTIQVAAAMVNNRFNELLQQDGCPFSSAVLRSAPITTTCDALELQVVARGEAIAKAFTSAYGELERIRRYGFMQEELETVRIGILRGGLHAYQSRNERPTAQLAQECIARYTRNTPLLSPEMNWAFTQLALKQMTLAQINELMKQLISPPNNVLVISAPERAKANLPKAEALGDFFTWVREAEIEPYRVEKIDKPLFSEQVMPGQIVEATKGMYGSTVWTLSNGVRVVVLPTAYSRNQVMMNAQAGGGLSLIGEEDYLTASMTTQITNASGVGDFNGEQLRKVLGTKTVSVQPSISRFASGMSGFAAKADVETMLQLTYLYFMRPNFDRNRFDMTIEANRMNLANMQGKPEFVQTTTTNRLMYGDNPRTKLPTEESLKHIDFDKMPQLYSRFFTDAAHNYTFYFLGDIDLKTLKPLVEKYIGSLPAGKQALAWKDDGVRVLPGTKEEHVFVPAEVSRSYVSFNYTGAANYTQQDVLVMGMLSACLQSRYTQTIREEKGGTYGVTVNGSLSRQPVPTYQLSISFQTAPQKAEELIGLVKEELARIAENGPDKADLAKHLEYGQKAQPESLKTNQAWFAYLQNYYTYGEEWNTDYTRLMKAITPERVQALARKILDDGNLKLVVVESD